MSKHCIGVLKFDTIIDSTLLIQIFNDLLKRGIRIEPALEYELRGDLVSPKDVGVHFILTKEVIE